MPGGGETVLIRGDAREIPLRDGCVQTVVTSPPYWGLRDYGVPGQLGLEKTPEEYVANMVAVFREVRRVLKGDGTLWLNLGDSYAGSWGNSGQRPELDGTQSVQREKNCEYLPRGGWDNRRDRPAASYKLAGLKPKDLVGIPWRVAFALQADGWWLRSDIIWAKPNPMPESVRDRPTKAHEYVFLLTKSERYYFDAAAVAEPVTHSTVERLSQPTLAEQHGSDRVPGKTNGNMKAVPPGFVRLGREGVNSRIHQDRDPSHSSERKLPRFGGGKYGDSDAAEHRTKSGNVYDLKDGKRNIRTVWTIATQPYSGAHFATFPEAIPERCIKAGTRPGDLVLDPFGGSGTTGRVAERLNRRWVCLDLKYQELGAQRTTLVQKELLA